LEGKGRARRGSDWQLHTGPLPFAMLPDWNTFLRQVWWVGILAAVCFVLFVLACLVLFAIALYRLDRATKELEPTIVDMRRTVLVVGGAATNLEKTLALERQAASAQIAQAQQAARSLSAAGAAANDLLRHTDAELNGPAGVLPALRSAVAIQSHDIASLELTLQTNLQDLDNAENALTPALRHFNDSAAALADGLPPILHNVNTTTVNVAGTTAELQASAHDVRVYLDRELAPVRGTWNLIKSFLVTFAGPAAQVATAVK
jgi:hypothetical protein